MISDILHALMHPQTILQHLGPFALVVTVLIVFAESGLIIFFFLPGDSLLFVAGFLAQNAMRTTMPIWLLTPLAILAAIIGDNIGYTFGKRVGRKLFDREDSKLFHKKHLVKAEQFYKKHGKKAIVLARFMPIIRTFAPIVAGIAHMDRKAFMEYNVIGGVLWAGGLTLAGYFFGSVIPAEQVDKYLLPIIFAIIVVSLIPSVLHLVHDRKHPEDATMV